MSPEGAAQNVTGTTACAAPAVLNVDFHPNPGLTRMSND